MTRPVKMSAKIYYEKLFNQVANEGFAGFLFSFTHKKLELIPHVLNKNKLEKILEVGAGSGQHLKYVKQNFSEYTLTDINFKFLNNYNNKKDTRIRIKMADVQNLPFKSAHFDRVICSCLLHHVQDFEKALLEMRRVTKRGGLVSIYLSCDPGIMNRLFRSIFIIPKAKSKGFDEYKVFIAKEHRNHFKSLEIMIKHVFKSQNIKQIYYPLRIKSWNLNTFCIFQIEIVSD